MPPRGPQPSIGLQTTPFTKQVLITLFGLYVGQLLIKNWIGLPVIRTFGWHGAETGLFRPWQPITAYLLNGPSVMQAFFDWLVLFFFLPAVQNTLGKKGVIRLSLFVVGTSAVLGFVLNQMGAVTQGGTGPFMGLNPLITAMIVVFGLTRPNAQILLFFVLPIRAAWIAWGTGLLAFLNFLAGRDLQSTLWLTGWLGAYFWLSRGEQGGKLLRKSILRWKQRKIQQRLQKFEVIPGGKDDDEPMVH